MLKPLLTILLLLGANSLFAQVQSVDSVIVNKSFTGVSIAPQFFGGNAAFRKFLSKNVRYPSLAIERRASGKTFVAFMVETNGTLSSIITNKDNNGFAKEAIRVIKLAPKWQPGISNGKIAKMRYSFSLDYNILREGFVTVDINLPEDVL